MKKTKYLLVYALGIIFSSCGSDSEEKNSGFSINIIQNEATFQLNDTLKASIENKNNRQIDSIQYFFKNKKTTSVVENETTPIVLQNIKLGNQELHAKVFSEGKEIEINRTIRILSNKKPVTYTYRVIATYPHDPKAYTQGLEFYKDTLYESTGQHGRSSLRKVDFHKGEVLKQVDLDQHYFAEGLTILDEKIYQLTWREGEGIIYDVNTFEKTGTFAYNKSKEGWGLCNDGEKLYKSDGTEKIWILNPETLTEEDYLQVVTHSSMVTRMNELEWVKGKIYANTYQKDGVAIINPKTGAIEGLIDFRGLREQLGNVNELDPDNDVLNGIAYNQITGKLYVTGKDWDKLFEVEIMEK